MDFVLGAYGQFTSPNFVTPPVSYSYEYPYGLNLKPGSELSKRICSEIIARAKVSLERMQMRYPSWNQIDRVLTAFVPLTDAEKAIKQKDFRKPVTIVVPYAYATMETLLTYLTNYFLQGNIFEYEGVGPEDLVGTALLEKIINQQATRTKVALSLHTMFRDCLAYSVGAGACSWVKRIGKRTVPKDQGFFSFLGDFIGTGKKRGDVETTLYEGNVLKNIDPYCYLPDPEVSIHDVQNGEFCGWFEKTNLMSMLSLEQTSKDIFNTRYLKHLSGKSSLLSSDQSKRTERFGMSDPRETPAAKKTPVDVLYMYANIIPKDWGLGDLEYPEKWYFAIAGNDVVIECRPLGMNHGMYPLGIIAPDFDGYSAAPVSRIETMYGLQETLDWLFSSHIANVRKSINDMLVVDPYLVNIEDLKDPEPGKLIRLKRAGWGKGLEGAVKQLAVTDVTRSHISDANYIIELMSRCSASSDSMQGITRKSSERITAEEVRGDRQNMNSRLERMAKVIGLQGFYDIAYLFAAHTQQLMSEETYVRIIGDWPKVLQDLHDPSGRLKVSPFDLLTNYDVKIKEASAKGTGGSEWLELYKVLGQNPLLMQQFDMVRIFKHIALLMGATDVNDFVSKGGNVQAQVQPNNQVMQQVQAGNLIPAEQVPTVGGGFAAFEN